MRYKYQTDGRELKKRTSAVLSYVAFNKSAYVILRYDRNRKKVEVARCVRNVLDYVLRLVSMT